MLATYSGSKAFLSTWSQALGEELKSKGIVVQLVNTFFVVRHDQIHRFLTTAQDPVLFRSPACPKSGSLL